MNKKLVCTLLCLNGICWANVAPYATPLLRGKMAVKSSDGSWKPSSSVAPGEWVQAKSSDTALAMPGATVRADAGTKVRYAVVDGQLNLEASGGRLFVAMQPGSSSITVSCGKKQVHASRGEFAVDIKTGMVSNFNDGDASSGTPVVSTSSRWKRGEKLQGGKLAFNSSNLVRKDAVQVTEEDLASGSEQKSSNTVSADAAEVALSAKENIKDDDEDKEGGAWGGGDSTLTYLGVGLGFGGLLALLLSNNNGSNAPSSP